MASDRMMEYYYSMGQDCLRMDDPENAVVYFKKAANMGASEAALEIFSLGQQWEKGDGIEKDEEKAENCYKLGVEYDIPEASLSLGKLYLRGINGAKPNPRKARRALENASDEGSAEAASLLGKMYDEGIMGKVNPDRAFNYYLLAAERGDSGAMLMTGMFYAQGSSARKDLNAAEMWIRKGRDAGDPDGDTTLRVFLAVACSEYITGEAGNIDPAKAWNMAGEAESLGDKEVFLRLGLALSHATSLKDHDVKAFEAFKRASDNGSLVASAHLGLCYEAGIGVEENIDEAVRLYKKASDEGIPFAMTHYACALAAGEGGEKDEKAAMNLLIRAAMKGDPGAIQILKEDYDYELA